jgi:hypothetical protein
MCRVRLWTLREWAECDSDYCLSAQSETQNTPWVRRVKLWTLFECAEWDSEPSLSAQSETLNTPWVCRVRFWTLLECAEWNSKHSLSVESDTETDSQPSSRDEFEKNMFIFFSKILSYSWNQPFVSYIGLKCPRVDMRKEDAEAFAVRNQKMKIIGHGKSPVPDVFWEEENSDSNKCK